MAGTTLERSLGHSRFARLSALASVVSLRELKARRRLRAARREADEEILRSKWVSPFLAWRVNELVARKNRVDLARSLRGVVRDADVRYLPNASPINRRAIRSESARLLAMADRLLELDSPVAPRGILLVEQLLVDGFGPLYSRERADELPSYLDATLGALEP